MWFKRPVEWAESLHVSIIEVSTSERATWAAPVVSSTASTDLGSTGEWESKFSAIVDSICTSYDAPLESFLTRTWD